MDGVLQETVAGGWRHDGRMRTGPAGAGAALDIIGGKHAAALTLRPLARLATSYPPVSALTLSAGDSSHRDPRVSSVCFSEWASLVASELTHYPLDTQIVSFYRNISDNFRASSFTFGLFWFLCCYRVFFSTDLVLFFECRFQQVATTFDLSKLSICRRVTAVATTMSDDSFESMDNQKHSRRKISLPWFRQMSSTPKPALTRQHTIDTPSSFFRRRKDTEPMQVNTCLHYLNSLSFTAASNAVFRHTRTCDLWHFLKLYFTTLYCYYPCRIWKKSTISLQRP